MTTVQSFVFSPFQENTYILYDETNECIIIDPGCYNRNEQKILEQFITKKGLTPVRLINTHCHLDHIFGNKFVSERYNLGLEIHEGELQVLDYALVAANMYGVQIEKSPNPSRFIEVGETISFGNTSLKTLFTPGHSPASISFFCKKDNFVISGDVLFFMSIGRTDLPGGNMETLLASIRNELFPLGDDVKVYSGHGQSTTIGFEKENNPFLNGQY